MMQPKGVSARHRRRFLQGVEAQSGELQCLSIHPPREGHLQQLVLKQGICS